MKLELGSRRHYAWALAAVIVVTAGVLAFKLRRGASSAPSSEFAPDPQLVRYRFDPKLERESGSDLSAAIRGLEARAAQPGATSWDTAELAELYFRRWKLAGDRADDAAAEAMARRSLEALPSPNAAVLTLAKRAAAHHEFREALELAGRHEQGESLGALTVRVTAHLALGELTAAADVAERWVAVRPDSAAYLMRALVMQAQGRDSEAAFDF